MSTTSGIRHDVSLLGEQDLHFFAEGTLGRAYRVLGAHPTLAPDGTAGTYFAVWAPNATSVSVKGDFDGWDGARHPLRQHGASGVFEGFLPGVGPGAHYKYHVVSEAAGYAMDKADPFGFRHETPPATGSIVWGLDYAWGDGEWMRSRGARQAQDRPMSIYELHLGSWRRAAGAGARPPGYREVAAQLGDYLARLNFTHVELLPIMEHPFYGSWGYQLTGYFAATGRYGTPQDLMYLIDTLHQRGIGVILDWVPSHFPDDGHGLVYFDGTHLYEHANPRQGLHPDWNTQVFNYGRHEVRSFLLSSALFWLDAYHADGLRVDAVASMLYLDYSRAAGEWVPNEHGGRENLEAVAFLRQLNESVYREYPDVQTIAEDSSSWPAVSRPLYLGGLGFGFKWDMGWMHDTLEYLACDPIRRKHHHHRITFRRMYAYAENFVMALSHDEVVHGKGSLFGRLPGDDWQRLANLRALLAYQYALPGKKLLFMGGEFGQRREWNHDAGLDWDLPEQDAGHAGVQRFVEDLNRVYRDQPALARLDASPSGFQWVDCDDGDRSTLSLLRYGTPGDPVVLFAVNFTPVPRRDHCLGVPQAGLWREVLNSDALEYGGTGLGNPGGLEAAPQPSHAQRFSLTLTLPPLAALFFVCEPARC